MRVCGIVLAVTIIFLSAETGLACTCAGPPPVAQARDEATAVFSGRVLKVKRVRPDDSDPRFPFLNVEVIFAVARSWKGIDRQVISVFTTSQSSACGYGFRSGRTYLVYAGGDGKGRLMTNICSRTKRVKDAREDLIELEAGNQKPSKSLDRSRGSASKLVWCGTSVLFLRTLE